MADENPTGTCRHCGEPVNRPKVNRFCSHRCAAKHLGLTPPSGARPIADRFWKKVDKTSTPDGCWEWIGSRTKKGYGRVGFGRNVIRATHRVSWELSFGDIPPGLFVCHRCDNPPCVRPDHLFLGTNRENVQDAIDKGRSRGGNAKVTEEEVRAIRAAAELRTYSALAREYGISEVQVFAIVSRRSWAHVE